MLCFLFADTADPLVALSDIRKQISEAKVLASQRADTITKMELIQHVNEELDLYRNSEKAGVFHAERTMKLRTLQKGLPKMVSNLKAELTRQVEHQVQIMKYRFRFIIYRGMLSRY